MISNYFYFMCVAAKALVCFAALYAAGINKKGKRMNLKEKWTKQNNSVKMLLRKLKRHDTVVVAIAVVIAVVLCGGLIYLSTPVVAASAKDELAQAQSKDNEQTIEKLDELSEYLNGLDKSITESKDSMTSFYEKDGEKNTEKMTNTVTEKVGGLGKDLSSLHETIIRTGTDIDSLREMIEKGGAESDKSITEKFTNIYNNLEEIENTYNETNENTRALIEEIEKTLKSGDEKLSKDLLESYKELLEKLNESNENLSKQNSDNLKEFREEIGTLGDQITSRLNELSTNINTNIDSQFDSMSISFESDMTGLKAYIAGEMSSMNDKVDQVFWRVSKGKKLLASTLLTKNVQIREDATFAEIAKAIESIPVQIVLDKDDVPGEVIYDYHYHIDGQENICDMEYVPVENKGGCYTEEYVHTHTDDCYHKTIYYTYWTDHSIETLGFVGDTWDGVARYLYHCKFCGRTFSGTNPAHNETTTDVGAARSRARNMPSERVEKTLICTTPEGTLLGYKPTCNLVHGQIVAAKIVFSEGYDKYNTSTDVIAPTNTDVTTSLMRVPAEDNNISPSAFWDDDLFWDLEPEDDDNYSLEKDINNNEDGDNNNDNKENGDEVNDADNDENNAGDDSSGGDTSDEQSDGDVSQTDDTVIENSDEQSAGNGNV